MSDATTTPLESMVTSLRADVSRLTTLVETLVNAGAGAGKRTLSLRQAAKQYGKSPRFLRALWAAGHIKGREVPGRGRCRRGESHGIELQLMTASIDAFFANGGR